MSQNRSRNERNSDDEDNSGYVAAGVVAGVAALAGGLYWLTRGKSEPETKKKPEQSVVPSVASASSGDSVSSYLADLMNRMGTPSEEIHFQSGGGRGQNPPPGNPCITNLNGLLSDIYVRYIQIKDSDFQLHYKVFDKIFMNLHLKMKEVDLYYKKYSSTVQFAGSHFDNLRIKKPDEFDMDIIISLPLNIQEHLTNPAESDIFIEPKAAGFVQLKMGTQFRNLPKRDGIEWQNNKAAYEWMDETHYLLRSKFLDWFKSVVNKALNKFEFSGYCPLYFVDGVPYSIRKSESGPAVTLIIENKSKGFQLDVDLVPALKFPEKRWPIGKNYRPIPPHCERGHWMVVGKPIKNDIVHDQKRSWRIALHNQERDLMYESGHLRQAMRLLKKVRDTLGMKKIASYYIKTLFFWEIVERNDLNFWQKNNPAALFKLMVGKLHTALINGKIPYFWNKSNNLIADVDQRILFEYAAKLVPLMQVLENPKEYKQVARYLLTPEEFREYNESFLHI